MKKIICPECGEVPAYSNFEIQKVYLFYDAYGREVDMAADTVGIRSSTVERCCYCQRKVKIYSVDEEQKSVSDDISITDLLEGESL